jgi:hypothetical protein
MIHTIRARKSKRPCSRRDDEASALVESFGLVCGVLTVME